MKTETTRQVAERVAWSVIGNHVEPVLRGQLIDAIEAVLNAERERCAKIAADFGTDMQMRREDADVALSVRARIAAAIRGKD